MIDYKFKAGVMNTFPDLISLQKEVSKAYYMHDYPGARKIPCNFTCFEDARDYDIEMSDMIPDIWNEVKKINRADYERKKHLQKKIAEMLQAGECLFVTFTFNNGTLCETKASSRRKFVQRYLANYSNNYVANIDFGKKGNREHYHAVIQTNYIDPLAWKYGNLDVERVHKTHSEERLAKYIAKLTYHAIKETTKRNVMIYGRIKK